MCPSSCDVPNDVREISWAESYRCFGLFDGELSFAAEGISRAKHPVRETQIGVKLDHPPQSTDRVVMPPGKKLIAACHCVCRHVAVVGRNGSPRNLSAARKSNSGIIDPCQRGGIMQREGQI